MRERFKQGVVFSESGIHCPLCGARMSRGSLACGHCRRTGRLHVDADKVRAVSKEVFLPRGLKHSA